MHEKVYKFDASLYQFRILCAKKKFRGALGVVKVVILAAKSLKLEPKMTPFWPPKEGSRGPESPIWSDLHDERNHGNRPGKPGRQNDSVNFRQIDDRNGQFVRSRRRQLVDDKFVGLPKSTFWPLRYTCNRVVDDEKVVKLMSTRASTQCCEGVI